MKRTTTVQWNVDLKPDPLTKDSAYMSLHVDPSSITLFVKDELLVCVKISEKELYQIKYMVDQSIHLIQQSNLNSYGVT